MNIVNGKYFFLISYIILIFVLFSTSSFSFFISTFISIITVTILASSKPISKPVSIIRSNIRFIIIQSSASITVSRFIDIFVIFITPRVTHIRVKSISKSIYRYYISIFTRFVRSTI